MVYFSVCHNCFSVNLYQTLPLILSTHIPFFDVFRWFLNAQRTYCMCVCTVDGLCAYFLFLYVSQLFNCVFFSFFFHLLFLSFRLPHSSLLLGPFPIPFSSRCLSDDSRDPRRSVPSLCPNELRTYKDFS